MTRFRCAFACLRRRRLGPNFLCSGTQVAGLTLAGAPGPGDIPAAITAEPAWHRRERRDRQAARGLLAVANAKALLRQHHGGGMGGPRQKELRDWACRTCTDHSGRPYRNYAWREQCRLCHESKGRVFGRYFDLPAPKAVPPPPKRVFRSPAAPPRSKPAQRERTPASQPHRGQPDELDRLRQEIARLRKQVAEGKPLAADDQQAMADESVEVPDETLDKDVDRLGEAIALLEKVVEVDPDSTPRLEALKAELAEKHATKRARKPEWCQLRNVESKLGRLEAGAKKCEARLSDIDQRMQALRQKKDEVSKQATQYAEDIVKLKEEKERVVAAMSAEKPAAPAGPEEACVRDFLRNAGVAHSQELTAHLTLVLGEALLAKGVQRQRAAAADTGEVGPGAPPPELDTKRADRAARAAGVARLSAAFARGASCPGRADADEGSVGPGRCAQQSTKTSRSRSPVPQDAARRGRPERPEESRIRIIRKSTPRP